MTDNSLQNFPEGIVKFIELISQIERPNLFNPWRESCHTEVKPETGPQQRRVRLAQHLSCPSPKLICLGEAPGYQGCRYSGIAFTSERLLLEGTIPRVPKLASRITLRDKPWSEPSATIVWKALYELGVADQTLLFNAVPWHPMKPGNIHSNRTPTREEKTLGNHYLQAFLDLYPDVPIIAVGNTADENLRGLGINCSKVRHPANGGATKFREGLREIVTRGF